METQTFEIDTLKCQVCHNRQTSAITYILYPLETLGPWIAPASEKYKTSIVVITGIDWDNDLTPWPAKGVPTGTPDFKGKAAQFLRKLEKLTVEIEKRLSLSTVAHRYLVGVSLSGLFTLWQWPKYSLFQDIACLSGSFWYEGFIEWFEKQSLSEKKGFAFFLLGKKEPHSPIPQFRTVGENTQSVISHLKSYGVRTEFVMVPGDHYQHSIARLDMAMAALAPKP